MGELRVTILQGIRHLICLVFSFFTGAVPSGCIASGCLDDYHSYSLSGVYDYCFFLIPLPSLKRLNFRWVLDEIPEERELYVRVGSPALVIPAWTQIPQAF
ncbi:hypothetical protein BJ165DRAFT_1511960 [Panaeolus papilionaceus]|nr:hypothetical protein BJ165DRAFT_1511960 [Panaeolus papilionaceus]